MEQTAATDEQRPAWFVGAWFGGIGDQTDRFLADGIWENGYTDRYLEDVRSIRPGDRIAIKSTYTQKNRLPFDSRGSSVAVMEIKAVGTVTENLGDGRRLAVAWERVEPPRKWYFYTHQKTIWRVEQGGGAQPEAANALIRFAFQGERQDLGRFRNLPFWRDRFGDGKRFAWTEFFSEVADQLLQYRSDRQPLVSAMIDISRRLNAAFPVLDKFADGTEGELRDFCPFSTFGCFNRGMGDSKRQSVAEHLAEFLDVQRATPTLNKKEDGIPILDPMKTWFFSYAQDRKANDIDSLWTLFETAVGLADADDGDSRSEFVRCYDSVIGIRGVRHTMVSMGLYWIRPWEFPPLDKNSKKYIEDKLECRISKEPDGQEYLDLRDRLQDLFHDTAAPVHSFPELSWRAYPPAHRSIDERGIGEVDDGNGNGPIAYTLDSILADGCFLLKDVLETILRRLRSRKNLILQGPPGTGKTWLAKRLALALLGEEDQRRVRRLQFHPNLSYEDFVRGHRPVAGELELTDGPFLKAMDEARKDPDRDYVVVIEEINRGNPAQIFGEMLTLLEADKRTPDEALALAFPRDERERVHIPPNLYLIGTMNVADRSLALVDLALRRRFAFVDLEPIFGAPWREWMRKQGGFDNGFLQQVANRMDVLNAAIVADTGLGTQFRVGHSYLTVPPDTQIDDPQKWYREVVETEIAPLLREYWFDQTDKADAQKEALLADF